MKQQQVLEDQGQPRLGLGPCWWCGDRATHEVLLDKPKRTKNHLGQAVEKRRAVYQPACPDCTRRLQGRYGVELR